MDPILVLDCLTSIEALSSTPDYPSPPQFANRRRHHPLQRRGVSISAYNRPSQASERHHPLQRRGVSTSAYSTKRAQNRRTTPIKRVVSALSCWLSCRLKLKLHAAKAGGVSNQITVVMISRMLRWSSRSSVIGEHIATSAASTGGMPSAIS